MKRVFQSKFSIPFCLFASIIGLTIIIGLSHRQIQQQHLRQESHLFQTNFASHLEAQINAYLNAVTVLGDRFQDIDPRDPNSFRAETEFVHDLFDDIQALNWIDQEGVIRTVTPLKGNEAALGLDLMQLEIPRSGLSLAFISNNINVSQPIRLAQGGTGFVVYLPLKYDGKPAGFLSAAFRTDKLISSTVRAFKDLDFSLEVSDGAQSFFSTGETHSLKGATPTHFLVGNRTWTIRSHPGPDWQYQDIQLTDEVIFVTGTALALILSALSFLLLDRQQTLREAQTRLQDFAISSSDWFWEMDKDLKLSWFSDGVYDAIGISIDSLLGKTRAELCNIQRGDDPVWDRHLDRLDARKPFKNFEYMKLVNGSEKWIRVSGVPHFDKDGVFMGYRGIASHITETVQARRAAENANQILSDSVESMNELFCLWDQDNRLVFGNRQFREMNADVPHVLAPGTPFEDFLRAGAEAGHMPRLDKTIDSFITSSVERRNAARTKPFEIQRRDGQILRLHEQRLSNGCIATVGMDVTEQFQSAQALRASEERLALAVEQVAIWDWDLTTDAVYVSPGFAENLGYTRDDFNVDRGDSYFDLIHPDERDRFHAAVINHLKDASEPFHSELRLRTKSGEYRWFSARGHALRSENGRAIRSSGVLTDITDRIALEDKLHQSQKMDAIGQLTGGVAHDFNNLLAVILGNAELIIEFTDDETLLPMMHSILRSAQRGADLTQRLLAFSRRQPLRPSNVDVISLLGGLPDLLRPVLGETIALDLSADQGTWRALADEGQLENAILNLALNARDAMKDGGVLRISCANASVEHGRMVDALGLNTGDYVVIDVIDNGTGMNRETLEHAFEPFFTTKGVGQGSGLGLSMVMGFAEQSGGATNIQSIEGGGTTITLFLPRGIEDRNTSSQTRTATAPEGQGEMILVIEDDPALRDLTQQMLERQSYNVITAADAAAARERLQDHPDVALILSDVVLPGGMSGPEFIDSLRDTHPHIKTVFMSGYPAEAISRFGAASEDQVLLTKPFQSVVLAKTVHQVLMGDRASMTL